jgi:predicted dehydrogenase
MQRRELLKSAGAGAGLLILPSGVLSGQNAPSNKLNVALIGAWGRGTAHYNVLAAENVVALCDVNENRLVEAQQVFPAAKTYWDWRKCLDQKGIDAVIICTADHHHAFICNAAMNRGMSVYCEKPLGITVEETRSVRATYLKNRNKLATQHGTQRHAFPNFERLRELILDGAIGELKSASAWDARQLPRPGYPPEEGQPPAFFHYVQWVGPSRMHPYSPQYFALPNAGNNCLSWNMYRDFGVGQMGDMGAHTMDLLWNVIDAGGPTSAEADMEVSDAFNPDVTPVKLKVTFEHAKNSWRGPITVDWYQGGLRPPTPRNFIDVTRIGNGAIFEGTKGYILADFNSRIIIPSNDDGDMTYYRRRSPEQLLPLVGGTGQPSPQSSNRPPAAQAARRGGAAAGPGGAPAQGARRGGVGPDGFPIVQLGPNGVPPAMGSGTPSTTKTVLRPTGRESAFQQEWLDACKGKNGRKTHCDFDYAGTMMEQMLLGLVAHAVGKKIQYDPVSGRVTNVPEANNYLRKEYTPGWNLNG